MFTDPAIDGVGNGTTDNTAAWNAAMARLAPAGGTLHFPAGVYRINGTSTPVPGGRDAHRHGHRLLDAYVAAARASVIRAGAAMVRLVQLGSDKNSSGAGQTAADARDIIFDGAGLATVTVKTAGRRNTVHHVQIYRGASIGLEIDGQNTYLMGRSVVDQNMVGD